MQCIKSIVAVALLCASATCATAQTTNKVAINHNSPTEILDINGTVRVRELPENGPNAIYNGINAKTTAYASTNLVVADANGVLGRGPAFSSNWFYMPPMNLPVDPSDVRHNAGVFTVDLYSEYSRQFTTPSAISMGATASLVKYPANKLDYYVLYYDPDAFTGVSISDAGVLKYSLKPNAVLTPETFFTVVYRIK